MDWPLTARATCLWRIDGSGNIYEFTPGGARSTFASGLDSPGGLAFNSAGDLFVADSDSGNIYEFTPDGVQSTFASGLSGGIRHLVQLRIAITVHAWRSRRRSPHRLQRQSASLRCVRALAGHHRQFLLLLETMAAAGDEAAGCLAIAKSAEARIAFRKRPWRRNAADAACAVRGAGSATARGGGADLRRHELELRRVGPASEPGRTSSAPAAHWA